MSVSALSFDRRPKKKRSDASQGPSPARSLGALRHFFGPLTVQRVGVHRLVLADLLHHPRILLRRELPQERAYLRLFILFLASPSEWTRYIAAWHSRILNPRTSFPAENFHKKAHIRLTIQPIVRDDEVEHCALAVAEGHLSCVEPRVEICQICF